MRAALNPFLLTVLLALGNSVALAQVEMQSIPEDWPHLDMERDGFAGISTYRAYEELLDGRVPQRRVIVAVIDSGLDTNHTGLQGRYWLNDNVTDTGYPGARWGWSFLGNPDGENVHYDTYEYAREYARLRPVYGGGSGLSDGHDEEEYAYFRMMRDSLAAKRDEFRGYQEMISMAQQAYHDARNILAGHFGTSDYTIEQVRNLETYDPRVGQAREIALYLDYHDLDGDALKEQADYVAGMLNYSLNPDFEPRGIVGDDYADPTERYYGSPDVHGPDPGHGTGVASIITTDWSSDFGVRGIASDSVFIMAVRAVPQGDERDKDVANAIRFAVDHGAHVINMSFGKPVSPHKDVVDDAVRYAMERGVLMVHAAGNDARDLTVSPSFPSRVLDDGEIAELWFEVGASTALPEMLAASFSNYGPGVVDVFAPGDDVLVLMPDNETDITGGTSFAAPHVSGLAALLMSHFPSLSATEVRQIILETATSFEGQNVLLPGSEERFVAFESLSTVPGVINVYNAVRRAMELTGEL